MKKNSLLVASIALGLLLSVFMLPDGSVFLAAALMAGLVMGVMRMNPKRVMKMTRWGKEN
ncbi:MAG: hypothetical protein JNJ57_18255, partial [Saprospiraceae bacterium]|nr:hypothetical protein [Saprospiraceae bacterium]